MRVSGWLRFGCCLAALVLAATSVANEPWKITNKVSPKKSAAFGSFIKVDPAWKKVQVDTEPEDGHQLSKEASKVGGSRDSRLVWTPSSPTPQRHTWTASTPDGLRVWVTIEGSFAKGSGGGQGGHGNGGASTWASNSVDLDLDVDSDRDGRIADPKRLPKVEMAEDKIEESNGAKLSLNGKGPMLLRRVLPTSRPVGTVTIKRENALIDIVDDKGKSIFADAAAMTSKDLWGDVKDKDLNLTMVAGAKQGKTIVTATYKSYELRFTDAVNVSVEPGAKPIALHLLNSSPKVYETLDFQIWINREKYEGFDKGLLLTRDFTPVDCFDAVDADGNEKSIKVSVMASTKAMVKGKDVWKEFDKIRKNNNAYAGESFWTPAYYARLDQDTAKENWKWYARCFVPKTGEWHFYVLVESQNGKKTIFPAKDDDKIHGYAWNLGSSDVPEGRWPRRTDAEDDAGLKFTSYADQAPIAPQSNGRRFFYRRPLKDGGSPQPFYLFGFCRCWNRWETNEKWKASTWGSAYADVNTEIFGPLAANFPKTDDRTTGTLLSHWFTCWDTNIVHSAAGNVLREEWRNRDNAGKGRDLESANAIVEDFNSEAPAPQSYQYFDQGRAGMMDEIMDVAESKGSYIMFTLWPHADIREEGVPWKKDRWCPPQPKHDRNTFSGWFPLNESFRGFLLNSIRPRSNEWKYQLNFYRYIVGRWGNRQGLGLWEGISEMDGPGMEKKELVKWSGRMRSEIRLLGPYNQPFSCSEHDLNGADVKDFEYVSTHGYYSIGRVRNNQEESGGRLGSLLENDDFNFKNRTVDVEKEYHRRTKDLKQPIFNGEFGATQRWMKVRQVAPIQYKIGEPKQLNGDHTVPAAGKNAKNYELREKTVSGCHDGLWASFMSGACATPLVWTDAKEFGEMQARSGCKLFSADNYGISFYRELKPLYRLITGEKIQPWNYVPVNAARLRTSTGYGTIGLKRETPSGPLGVVWIYQRTEKVQVPRTVNLTAVAVKKGSKIQWFDPWAGVKIGKPQIVQDPTKVDFWTNGMSKVKPDGYGRRRHQTEDVVGIVLAD